jgi:hypothetical protein
LASGRGGHDDHHCCQPVAEKRSDPHGAHPTPPIMNTPLSPSGPTQQLCEPHPQKHQSIVCVGRFERHVLPSWGPVKQGGCKIECAHGARQHRQSSRHIQVMHAPLAGRSGCYGTHHKMTFTRLCFFSTPLNCGFFDHIFEIYRNYPQIYLPRPPRVCVCPPPKLVGPARRLPPRESVDRVCREYDR